MLPVGGIFSMKCLSISLAGSGLMDDRLGRAVLGNCGLWVKISAFTRSSL